MTRIMIRFVPITALLLLAADTSRADPALPASLRDVRFEQRLNEQIPLAVGFRDEAGRTIQLDDYFHQKPVILVLAYYRCPMLCTEVLNGLVRALLDVPLDVGKDFEVLTVSFDARETPELAAAKKKTYLERYRRPGAEKGWHFLTGEQSSIDQLTQAVGFHPTYDARNDQFAHASGIMILTPNGKLSRYFYDVNYSPRDVRLGLVEASEGKISAPGDQILLFCFHYDPIEGKYGATVMNFVRLGGVVTVLALAGFLGVMWRQEWRKRRPEKAQDLTANKG